MHALTSGSVATVYIKNICISTGVSQVIEFVLWVVKLKLYLFAHPNPINVIS